MVEPKIELVRAWLRKAEHDLGSAKRLAEEPEAYLDTAIYHCQQAAEKALKTYLLFQDVEFEKIHNLSVLLELCTDNNAAFQKYEDAADTLTPYATAFRYPSEFFEDEPDEEQVQEALALAEAIYKFILDHLPEECHPK